MAANKSVSVVSGRRSHAFNVTSFFDLYTKSCEVTDNIQFFLVQESSGEEITANNYDKLVDGDVVRITIEPPSVDDITSKMAALSMQSNFKLSDFELKQTVGTGTFGRVILSQHKSSGLHCVLKVLRKTEILRQKQLEHILSERAILNRVHHPFIVNLMGFFQDEVNVYMVIEFVAGGELFTILGNYGKLPKPMAQFYAAEILLALQYLHGFEIAYRDLKPENILIDKHGHVKITDFGFAKILDDRTYTVCGTMDYLAPEIIKKSGHSFGVDFWALGVLIYEMLTGFPPFYDDNALKSCEKIMAGEVDFSGGDCDADAIDLISKLLTDDLTKRLGCLRGGAKDIMEHPFFEGIDWDALLKRKIPPPYTPQISGDDDTSQFDEYEEEDIRAGPTGDVDQALFAEFG